jgi:hypothetical protein
MALGVAGKLFAWQVRSNARKAGIAGLLGGLAFNMLLKRSVPGAVVMGGVLLVHRLMREGRKVRAVEKKNLKAKAKAEAKAARKGTGPGAPSANVKAASGLSSDSRPRILPH